jgi:RNA polymerase sigma-70 factor (ECF subfamily)
MADTSNTRKLLTRAGQGEAGVLAELFAKHRARLRAMVELRLDRRMQGRVDPSDVLQDAYLEAARSFPTYLEARQAPFYLWLRCLTARKLRALHRHHLGAKARDARREVPLDRSGAPPATSVAVAAKLLGRGTSPSEAAARAERRERLEAAIEAMPPLDREVLILRHFEELSTAETAEVLAISEAAAVQRHVRALKRLRTILGSS